MQHARANELVSQESSPDATEESLITTPAASEHSAETDSEADTAPQGSASSGDLTTPTDSPSTESAPNHQTQQRNTLRYTLMALFAILF